MFVRTERLFLRPVFPEDWRAVLDGIGEEDIVRNLARAPWPYGEADARDFCARPFDAAAPSLMVTLPGAAGSEIIGGCGYGPRETDGAIEIGYWIAHAHRRCGYASEAARGVVGLARMAGQKRLVAGHFVDNSASGRVLLNAGFQPTGEIGQRYSAGRGEVAQFVEYRLDLTAGESAGGLSSCELAEV